MSETGCDNAPRHKGRLTTLQVALQCATENPATTTYSPLGAVNTKSLAYNGSPIEINDSSSGGLTENMMGQGSIAVSLSGNCLREDGTMTVMGAIERLWFNSCISGEKSPVILIEYARPVNTLVAYMMVSSVSIEDPTAEMSTWTMDLVLAQQSTYPPTLTATA
jgi:hypothetical protein